VNSGLVLATQKLGGITGRGKGGRNENGDIRNPW
jgi:hypothetical protein